METSNPFSICFNMMKIKYATYDESISSMNVLRADDKINVFINVETILKYLSTVIDLEKKLIMNRNHVNTMTVDLLNLAAHYKEFFCNNNLDTKVFLYMTDLDSEEEMFHECKYNIDYRCYYLNKYNGNPKFGVLKDSLKNDIIPKVKTICEFIPNVYFIQSKNIDGSLIPYIIGNELKERKNFIISGDIYESQYQFIPNFKHHLFKRHYQNSSLSYDINSFLKVLSKNNEISLDEKTLFSNYGFYLTLLSVMGDKYRSVDNVGGIGYKKIFTMLNNGLKLHKIAEDVENIEIMRSILDNNIQREQFEENFNSLSLKNSISLLTEPEMKMVLSQITDRSDVNSLLKLNQTVFKEHDLRIESLLR